MKGIFNNHSRAATSKGNRVDRAGMTYVMESGLTRILEACDLVRSYGSNAGWYRDIFIYSPLDNLICRGVIYLSQHGKRRQRWKEL